MYTLNCLKDLNLNTYLQGLYAMSMNCMEAAEAQFNTAIKVNICFIKQYFIHEITLRFAQ